MSNEAVSGWRVASYTGGQGNCVEVGRSVAAVAVLVALTLLPPGHVNL